MDLCLNNLASKYGRRTVSIFSHTFPADNYTFKVNNSNTRTMCEICSKWTMKTPARRQWRRSGVFIVSFEPCVSVSARISSKKAQRKSVILLYS